MFEYIVSNLVADGVPEVEHAMWPAEETRAKARIGPTFNDGLEELGPDGGIVFQVRVLHDDHITGAHR